MEHLKQNNQTYIQHFKHSIYYAWRSFNAAFYFFIHAFIPELFQTNGSTEIKNLTKYFE